jgi:hypothetical protein
MQDERSPNLPRVKGPGIPNARKRPLGSRFFARLKAKLQNIPLPKRSSMPLRHFLRRRKVARS